MMLTAATLFTGGIKKQGVQRLSSLLLGGAGPNPSSRYDTDCLDLYRYAQPYWCR
jgi:hypothetical protein